MYRAHTFVYPFMIYRIVAKVKVIRETTIRNAISLDAIPNTFELPIPSFILALPLNLAILLVDIEVLRQNPSFPTNMTTPPK